ncbi:helix-turn-helix domain-containing protein [Peptoniphilus lacrimalis]|uniref:DNA-binding helix-turn-helix protein n=1 Tax=Peptoniphilus lacrimalis 315-B TaxID=596330 RepID=D1VSS9_9FIRM|nr:helix-turn-helix transcriptional regulator [Peptoniphilus lacrimalis]EFA90394.1 DNA-binding helix-turn-helix protein [Peptoniphilus lacrimalis 315-B]
MTLGEKIRKYRILNNLTMKELSEKLGMSISAIQKYENGTVIPKTDIIQKISKILNVPINKLLEETSAKNDKEDMILEKIIELTKYDQIKWIKCEDKDIKNKYKLYEDDFLEISKIIDDSIGYSSYKSELDIENDIKELSIKIMKNGFITNVKDTLYILYDEGYVDFQDKKIYELKAFQYKYHDFNYLIEFTNRELLTNLFSIVNEKANINDGDIDEILLDLDKDLNNLIDDTYGF